MKTIITMFAKILFVVVSVVIVIVGLPFVLVAEAYSYIKKMAQIIVFWLEVIDKRNKNEISKEQSEEETQINEEPIESVFEDVGV